MSPDFAAAQRHSRGVSPPLYTCAPVGARMLWAWCGLVYCFPVGVAAALIARGALGDGGWFAVVLASLVPLTLLSSWRGSRVALFANSDSVVVRNVLRTQTIGWDDITTVGVGSVATGRGSRRAVFTFHRKRGCTKALACPNDPWQQDEVLTALAAIAPKDVAFSSVDVR